MCRLLLRVRRIGVRSQQRLLVVVLLLLLLLVQRLRLAVEQVRRLRRIVDQVGLRGR